MKLLRTINHTASKIMNNAKFGLNNYGPSFAKAEIKKNVGYGAIGGALGGAGLGMTTDDNRSISYAIAGAAIGAVGGAGKLLKELNVYGKESRMNERRYKRYRGDDNIAAKMRSIYNDEIYKPEFDRINTKENHLKYIRYPSGSEERKAAQAEYEATKPKSSNFSYIPRYSKESYNETDYKFLFHHKDDPRII